MRTFVLVLLLLISTTFLFNYEASRHRSLKSSTVSCFQSFLEVEGGRWSDWSVGTPGEAQSGAVTFPKSNIAELLCTSVKNSSPYLLVGAIYTYLFTSYHLIDIQRTSWNRHGKLAWYIPGVMFLTVVGIKAVARGTIGDFQGEIDALRIGLVWVPRSVDGGLVLSYILEKVAWKACGASGEGHREIGRESVSEKECLPR